MSGSCPFFPSFSGANERVKEECSDNWLVSASRPKREKKKVWFGRKQKREPFGPRGKVVRPGLRVSRYTVEAINRFFILFGRYNNIPPPRREWSVRSNQESVTDD